MMGLEPPHLPQNTLARIRFFAADGIAPHRTAAWIVNLPEFMGRSVAVPDGFKKI